jgi:hypothetical protein
MTQTHLSAALLAFLFIGGWKSIFLLIGIAMLIIVL